MHGFSLGLLDACDSLATMSKHMNFIANHLLARNGLNSTATTASTALVAWTN